MVTDNGWSSLLEWGRRRLSREFMMRSTSAGQAGEKVVKACKSSGFCRSVKLCKRDVCVVCVGT